MRARSRVTRGRLAVGLSSLGLVALVSGIALPDHYAAPPEVMITISDAVATETGCTGASATFFVQLSRSNKQIVSVEFATADGTATVGSDYDYQSGVLTFQPKERTKTIVVAITDDQFTEGTETFLVNLSNPVNANISDGQGLGTIFNDLCDDADRCTVDSCNQATRTCSHAPANCDDRNVCTSDSCDSTAGCVHQAIDLGQTTCGTGACEQTVQNCVDGVPQTCTPGTPTAEVCNGIDDDCDGAIDGSGSEASCQLANATPQCVNGACAIGACVTGFGDCDGALSDGCETPLNTLTDCGACGNICAAPPNATPTCAAGTCAFSCNPGFGDCDGTGANGCESDLTTTNNCGGCGTSCDDGNACTVDSCDSTLACSHGVDLRTCRAAPTSGVGGASCATVPSPAGCWGSSCTTGTFEVVTLPEGCLNPDSDGDGLPDMAETHHAIDGNCDGDFSDLGAGGLDLALPDDPDWDEVTQKNLYVVYDYMAKDSQQDEAQHEPLPDFVFVDPAGSPPVTVKGPITRVVEAFARQGIRLKVEKNTKVDLITEQTEFTSPLPHQDVVTLADPPGECALNSGANSAVSFNQVKAANFDPRRKFTHKYALFAHHVQCDGNCASSACVAEASGLGLCEPVKEGTTGLAEMAGEDIIISLGGQGLDDGSTLSEPSATAVRDELARYQSGALMHELGHTFGLDHGGATPPSGACAPDPQSGINRKPNLISSMSYALQFSGIRTAATNCSTIPILPDPPYPQLDPGDWRVDYSSSALPDLDESALDENAGISSCTCGMTEGDGVRDISIAYAGCNGLPRPIPGCGPVDWNGNGFLDPTGAVSVDINEDHLDDAALVCPFLGILSGFDDWSYVKAHLAFQCGTTFVDGSASHPSSRAQ